MRPPNGVLGLTFGPELDRLESLLNSMTLDYEGFDLALEFLVLPSMFVGYFGVADVCGLRIL